MDPVSGGTACQATRVGGDQEGRPHPRTEPDDRDWIASRGGEALASKVSVWPLPVEAHSALPRPAGQRLLILGSLRSLGRAGGVRWFLREVWPRVRAVRPEAELDIVGADPPPDLRAADGRDGVCVHGFVEDLSHIFEHTQACLIPLFAGGGIG